MIKTLIDDNIDELDKRVNEFMREQQKNLPVRTETFLFEHGGINKVFHKCTIFFDQQFKLTKHEESIYDDEYGNNTSKAIPEEPTDNRVHRSRPQPKATSTGFQDESIGALWWSKDGTALTGKIGDNKVSVSEGDMDFLANNDGDCEITFGRTKTVIKKNKFKKAANHPDYKIYKM